MGKRVLLTGATGFIGSHIVEKLVLGGYEVLCAVRQSSDISFLKKFKLDIKYADLSDVESIKAILASEDIIIHNAGLTKSLSNTEYYKVNVEITKNVLEAAKAKLPKLERFVYIGSQAAAGPNPSAQAIDEISPPVPITPYGKSKLEAEGIVMQYSRFFPITILRPSAVFGPKDKDILFYFKSISFGFMPFLGKHDPLVSLIYVEDLARAIVLAADHPKAANQIFFISDGKFYRWSVVADTIAQILKKKCLRIRIPIPALNIIGALYEFQSKVFKTKPLLNRYKIDELSQKYWVCSSNKIFETLGFKPAYSLEEALSETAKWYKKNRWI